MKILEYPDERLRVISAPIEEIDDEIKHLARVMIDIVEENDALGLAAVQIGFPIRLIVGRFFSDRISVMVNPKIRMKFNRKVTFPESCLSVPDKSVYVTRSDSVAISYHNLQGKLFAKKLVGYQATLFQHEYDHLNGKLIVDYEETIDEIV